MAGAVIHSGYTVLCCAESGEIGESRHGLYDFDTRIVSRWRLTLDGKSPELVAQATQENDTWQAVLRLAQEGGAAAGPRLPQDALEIDIRREVGPAMRETIALRNWSPEPFEARLEIEFDADFADISGAEDDGWRELLKIERQSAADGSGIDFSASATRNGRGFDRRLSVRVGSALTVAAADDRLSVDVALGGHGDEATIVLDYVSFVDGVERRFEPEHARRIHQRVNWQRRRTVLEAPARLSASFERAASDLFALRNWELEERFSGSSNGAAWLLNAGVPTFTGLFGRDVLTSAWQSALLGPRATLGALAAAAATQSESDDAWRDAEPGKMIHELRRGPVADLGVSPRDAYYGSQTTPHMFVLALSELWHWTGDIEVLGRYRDAALSGLEWAARYGDRDGDGFLEYQRRSPKGLANQGWKDSDEAIRHADGALAVGPMATVEEQAFYFIALQRMGEILIELDEDELAESYLQRAEDLRRRWHDAFWMPGQRFYAMALDGSKQQVQSIGSNPGHALGCGIVPPEHAQSTADRLLAPDLFSGWGVRTLSAEHPSYNPFAYHLGSVWPVEQATFALGIKRYGLDAQADRLTEAVLAAAAAASDHRLPEALAGHASTFLGQPVPYPAANSPQAWSAGAVVQLVQIMLGLYPFAPLGLLALVRPRLPDWLPELTLRRLRVGKASVDIRFERRPDGSASHHVVQRRGRLLVLAAGPPEPASDDQPFGESVIRAALQAMPGDRLRALRVALGLHTA